MSTLGRWRATAVTAAAAIAVAAVAAGPAASAATGSAASAQATSSPAAVTITIGTRSALPKVTGRTLVAYRGPSGSTVATVSGTVSGAHQGDKATLLYEPFGAKAYARGGSVTLAGGQNAKYSFRVRPEIATNYRIQVTGTGLGVPDSAVRTVFVEALGAITGKRACPGRPGRCATSRCACGSACRCRPTGRRRPSTGTCTPGCGWPGPTGRPRPGR